MITFALFQPVTWLLCVVGLFFLGLLGWALVCFARAISGKDDTPPSMPEAATFEDSPQVVSEDD